MKSLNLLAYRFLYVLEVKWNQQKTVGLAPYECALSCSRLRTLCPDSPLKVAHVLRLAASPALVPSPVKLASAGVLAGSSQRSQSSVSARIYSLATRLQMLKALRCIAVGFCLEGSWVL